MIRLLASVSLLLPLFLFVLIGPTLTEVQLEGISCVCANQTMGVYKRLKQCPSLYKMWLPTTSEANVIEDSIWCCPNAPTLDSYAIAEAKCKIYSDNRKRSFNIADGVETNAPLYNVAIYSYNTTTFENFMCDGTLISERYVVTTAICAYKWKDMNADWIRAGVLNINKTGGQSIKIIKKKIYPGFDVMQTAPAFIALLELESNVIFDENVQPACLPYTSLTFTEGKSTGWGAFGFGLDISPVLYEVTLPIRRCTTEAEWKLCVGEDPKHYIWRNTGGPLAVLNKKYKNMYTLVGVTNGVMGFLDTFTNVSYYVPWIQRTVWPTGDCVPDFQFST